MIDEEVRSDNRSGVIRLRGVRVHNLRGIDVEIPLDRLTVITGVSGSGKSSLAFDTLYAEGRRRFVECLSTYTRQFLDRADRPDLDGVDSIPPAIALHRSPPAFQARSTVGTATEINDHLRLLFARAGRIVCSRCGGPVEVDTVEGVAGRLLEMGGRATIAFSMPLVRARDAWAETVARLERDGFSRVLLGDRAVPLREAPAPADDHIEVAVDRVDLAPDRRARVAEAIETGYRFGGGRCLVVLEDGRRLSFSRERECARCGERFRPLQPALFSPNSPLGACPDCQGFGRTIGPDLDRIVPDPGRTLAEGAIDPWNKPAYTSAYDDLRRAGRRVRLPWNVPYQHLSPEHRALVEHGDGEFYGIHGFFRWLETKTYKVHVRVFLARYRAYVPCEACGGTRLRPEALAAQVGGRSIAEITGWPVERAARFLDELELGPQQEATARPILAELRRRLSFLLEVGLGYLTLDRAARTLSGGEFQRIQLARCLGTGLVDTLYVLDEPSVGLHPKDVGTLLAAIGRLRDLGNTVVMVEHDAATIRSADHLVDLGPRAGEHGGQVVFQGSPAALAHAVGSSLTADYLTGRRAVDPGAPPATAGATGWIELRGASTHNLQDVTVRFPRACLTAVTGVSGSGKSSLIVDTLHGALARAAGDPRVPAGPYRALLGAEAIAAVEMVDASPPGRTPRSNPATYVKAFEGIRRLLAETPAARAAGLGPGFFSFNRPGGRCEGCEGAGQRTVEMHFLPDVTIPCEACGGRRFGPRALEVRARGRTVADILAMTVDDAIEAFRDRTEVAARLRPLSETGLGYLRLGQPLPTLSGGEAQRLKLATHLASSDTRARVFLLDEPTRGLHLHDLAVLLRVLRRLVAAGHTVVVVEHHLDLVRAVDWVIDLGPGGGPDGGRVVAEGTPAQVAASGTETGTVLERALRG